MARPLRLEHPGAVWHITSRGNERRNIVRSDRDRRCFVDLLADITDELRQEVIMKKAAKKKRSVWTLESEAGYWSERIENAR